MAHILQLVRVLPFAEAGTDFSCVYLPDVVFHRLAHREGATSGIGTEAGTNASGHSDLATAAAKFRFPRETDPYFYR